MKTDARLAATLVLNGYSVSEAPAARDGMVYALDHERLILVGTGQPEVAHAGRMGRWYVRRGMADVLAWLGEDVGPEPVPEVGRRLLDTLREF